VYDSQYHRQVQAVERAKAQKSFAKSRDPSQTVVGSTFREDRDFEKQHKTVKSNLAGIEIPTDQFVHNNMIPFFGSRTKQNMNPDVHRSTLETFTGEFGEDVYTRKREQKPLFDPSENVQNIYGNRNQNELLLDRYEQPRVRNYERPFEQIRVGPGLGEGFSATDRKSVV